MLTPNSWTVLVLNNIRLRWCLSSKPMEELNAGRLQFLYTRLLWTIPEEDEREEETTFPMQIKLFTTPRNENLVHSRQQAVMKTPPSGGACRCKRFMKSITRFTSLKKLCKSRRVHHRTETEAVVEEFSRAIPIPPCPRRSRANEEVLGSQCKEVMELYTDISEGKLPLEKLLDLRL
ncbi:hypothetical protein MPTK1_2g24560 [Marchantia polymorpha subsp. ruderalis]|nr:hypothetical protein MARPO_0221s0008 [Marchantia polymorpha]BBN03570.1 hypothetical protein Mp_2g24560 [Marchantia polymorpha subsp. ruderalis]|eukprot:PTQ27113.1 hypothetical protein MARPO_0221s0008 [Marchantia polymorpha]